MSQKWKTFLPNKWSSGQVFVAGHAFSPMGRVSYAAVFHFNSFLFPSYFRLLWFVCIFESMWSWLGYFCDHIDSCDYGPAVRTEPQHKLKKQRSKRRYLSPASFKATRIEWNEQVKTWCVEVAKIHAWQDRRQETRPGMQKYESLNIKPRTMILELCTFAWFTPR